MLVVSGSPKQGFSLIEILVAIAIIGLILATVGPRVMTFFSGAKVDTTKQSLLGIKSTLDMFNLRHGEYPETLKDLYRKPSNEELAKNWNEAYIDEKKLVDAWKQKFHYTKTPGGQHPYELYSYGPKGKSTPKNEWIDVWNL